MSARLLNSLRESPSLYARERERRKQEKMEKERIEQEKREQVKREKERIEQEKRKNMRIEERRRKYLLQKYNINRQEKQQLYRMLMNGLSFDDAIKRLSLQTEPEQHKFDVPPQPWVGSRMEKNKLEAKLQEAKDKLNNVYTDSSITSSYRDILIMELKEEVNKLEQQLKSLSPQTELISTGEEEKDEFFSAESGSESDEELTEEDRWVGGFLNKKRKTLRTKKQRTSKKLRKQTKSRKSKKSQYKKQRRTVKK